MILGDCRSLGRDSRGAQRVFMDLEILVVHGEVLHMKGAVVVLNVEVLEFLDMKPEI